MRSMWSTGLQSARSVRLPIELRFARIAGYERQMPQLSQGASRMAGRHPASSVRSNPWCCSTSLIELLFAGSMNASTCVAPLADPRHCRQVAPL